MSDQFRNVNWSYVGEFIAANGIDEYQIVSREYSGRMRPALINSRGIMLTRQPREAMRILRDKA